MALESAERGLICAGIPPSQWIYIGANSEYHDLTPKGHRLGGFSCDKRWAIKDRENHPALFYTVVDGSKVENVLYYVCDYSFYIKENNRWIDGEEDIKTLIETSLQKHQKGLCTCNN